MPRAPTAGRIARCGLGLLSWLMLVAGLDADTARAALDAGRPACDYCRMIFGEAGFGGEIATRSGQRKIYDSVECMAAAVLTDSVSQGEIRAIWLVDHVAPHARLPLPSAIFLHCPALESPMGLSLAAFATRRSARRACSASSGRLLDWRGVLTQVDRTWFQGELSVERHAAIPHMSRARHR